MKRTKHVDMARRWFWRGISRSRRDRSWSGRCIDPQRAPKETDSKDKASIKERNFKQSNKSYSTRGRIN